MSYPINYPTPQGANIQIFSEGGTTSDWVKPQGASFVWFTLIGAGGGGGTGTGVNSGQGGGSGAVTNFMGPAFLMPDVLSVTVGKGGNANTAGTSSKIGYLLKTTTEYELLSASGGGAGTVSGAGSGGSSMSANYFTAMGFFQSISGQSGSNGSITASATTFLCGGTGSGSTTSTANYGYAPNNSGFFQFSPIIVGTNSKGNFPDQSGAGCGGAGTQNTFGTGGIGGDGRVVIITW